MGDPAEQPDAELTKTEPPSEELARAAQLGDSRALAVLLERHKHEAYRVALRITGSAYDAEEVLQGSLERVLRHIRRYDSTRPFRPWLMRIVVNRARSYLRTRKLKVLFFGTPPEVAAAPGSTPHAALVRRRLRVELEAALKKLPLNQREAFVLKHIEGLSYEEIAEVTGDSSGSLKVRVHRARRTLHALLSARAVTFAPDDE